MDALEGRIRELAAEAGAASIAVACWPVAAPAPLVVIDGDRALHAASTMKLAVLVELHRRVAAGDLALGDPMTVRNAFASIVDASPFRLDPADDSETALYAREGDAVPMADLAELMITVSSNLATNLLVDRLGPARITATMAGLGLDGIVVRRGVEDGPAFDAGLNNTVTALDLARLLVLLGRGEVISAGATAAMLEVLEAQQFNEGIPTGLPAGTPVAHKTGSIRRLYHDAALVRPQGAAAYALVVLTTGLDEERDGPALVSRIAAACHERLSER
ncbi:MAG: serine hydrolase [Chloroflexota bacterium]